VVLVALLATAPPVLPADDGIAPDPAHVHVPITVDVAPVIERLRLSLVEPRRILPAAEGRLLIADARAGVVFAVDRDGTVEVLLEDLDDPVALALDSEAILYVAENAGGRTGAGSIIRLYGNGTEDVLVGNLTSPEDLACDVDGNLYFVSSAMPELHSVTPDGRTRVVNASIKSPSAVAVDVDGRIHVTSRADGTLLRISRTGDTQVVGCGLTEPTDIAFDGSNQPVVASAVTGELVAFDNNGLPVRYASVPRGTVGIDFDAAGNLCLVNSHLQTAARVTSRISIACPHCDEPIPLRLKRLRVDSTF